MTNKTAPINLMVEPETKKKLVDKAKQLNMTITSYLEKIALEPVIFVDENLKAMLKTFTLNI